MYYMDRHGPQWKTDSVIQGLISEFTVTASHLLHVQNEKILGKSSHLKKKYNEIKGYKKVGKISLLIHMHNTAQPMRLKDFGGHKECKENY